jgi:thioredoxin-related protein
MKYLIVIALIFLAQLSFALGSKAYNAKYDPARDVFADFKMAQSDAKAENKLILLEFGGDWCIWCHRLDRFFTEHEDLSNGLSDVFIVLKVNVSEDTPNEKFISQFSKITGYPHFIITDSSGKEIGVKNTGTLEEGKSYSVKKLKVFIEQWKQNENANAIIPE